MQDKKIKSASKISLADTSSLEDDLDKMAEFVIQVYKQIFDFNNGHYPMEISSALEKIFPIILTFTEWHAYGDKIIKDFLDKKITGKLSNLTTKMHKYSEMYPYTICSIDDFEKVIQVISEVGANHFMSKKTEDEYRLWAMSSYLHKFYKDQLTNLKSLFSKDFESICAH